MGMTIKEVWKPVCGYEGLYEVSDLGNVRSLPRNTTKGKVLKPYINTFNGYAYVCLSKDNRRTQKRVHALVMMAFCPVDKKPGYDPMFTIDHVDGNKTNNELSNLEWCTQAENQRRAYKLGLQKTECLKKKVINLDTFEIFDSLGDAARSVGGHKGSAITRVCRGVRSHYRNAHFAYYSDYINGTIPKFTGRSKRSSETLWQ